MPPGFTGACDVHFDDHHTWSFSVDAPSRGSGGTKVEWPKRLRRFLEGASRVRVTSARRVIFDDEVAFGDGEGRVSLRDKHGVPFMVDKWGLLQHPFSGRDKAVVTELVELTEVVLQILREDCGIDAWMAFGTLLGAAREGGVIGHDSDVDLAYLSEASTPAEMALELYGMTRALRRRGLRVVTKSASFITVVFTASDGVIGSIDVYTTFYVGEYLHETATVRAPVPRSAVLPLTELEFEGRMLPAPADVDAMLAVSYGPGWRVPDPSFRHQPSNEIKHRFDAWFGSLMRQRREWESRLAESDDLNGSEFADWVLASTATDARIVDVGCGRGGDVLHWARAGRWVLGLDYARGSFRPAARVAKDEGLRAGFGQLNLLDLRSTWTRAAMVSRDAAPAHVVTARGLVEALDRDGRENFWNFVSMVVRGGGSLFLEGEAVGRARPAVDRADESGPRLRPVDPSDLIAAAERLGGRLIDSAGTTEAGLVLRTRSDRAVPARWRLAFAWGSTTESTGSRDD